MHLGVRDRDGVHGESVSGGWPSSVVGNLEKQMKAEGPLELRGSQGGPRKTQKPPLGVGGYWYSRAR